MTSPFATADDAARYSRPLPDAAAAGLLLRATQAIIDAAGFGILSSAATVRLQAECGMVSLEDIRLVTAVTAVAVVNDDGTTEDVTAWSWPGNVAGKAFPVYLQDGVPGRHCGVFAVSLVQGLASVPDSLKKLTVDVAYRFAAMPAAMAAGITSRSVGGVSWTAAKPPPDGELTGGECSRLKKIVPLQTVRPVRM